MLLPIKADVCLQKARAVVDYIGATLTVTPLGSPNCGGNLFVVDPAGYAGAASESAARVLKWAKPAGLPGALPAKND
jgi:hypothetical protein